MQYLRKKGNDMEEDGSSRKNVIWLIFLGLAKITDRLNRAMNAVLSGLSRGRVPVQNDVLIALNEGHEQGTVSQNEVELIHNIFELEETEAKDIMVHRKNLAVLSDDTLLKDAIEYAVQQNKSRLPVYHEDMDNIVGQIHIKDLLVRCMQQSDYDKRIGSLPGLVREIDLIPEITKINRLYKMMQAKKRPLVVVVDEYGQTAGLIALEDILEEIVGEIEDEHDKEIPPIRRLDETSYLIQGFASLEEVAEQLEFELENDMDIDTMNGYVTATIGKIPGEHEQIEFASNGYHFKVTDVENKTIRSVIATKLAGTEKEW
jgi:Hemolysins and related proteins containing CBS domains